MDTVRQVLKVKGSDIWSIAAQATVYEALEVMADKNVGALLVIDGKKVVGILSERDYARRLVLKGKSSKETSVGELMTQKVFCVGPGDSLEHCMALMTAKGIRHLPVMEDDQLIGILSIGDVVKRVIAEQEFAIDQLVRYISGA